ncbi:MAG: M50 family metallopeptidase [Acidobacteria bacterium]|nr:M50 family metallopeptidase [Acidobacteriota bacterium]
MLTLRKLLRACFANAALIYLVASFSVLPALIRMRADNHRFLEEAPRSPTFLENLLLLLAQFIFVLPVILTACNGIAWWALRAGKRSARVWALIASASLLLTGVGLWSIDFYVNSRFPTGHPPLFAWIIGGHVLVGIAGIIAFTSRDSALTDSPSPRVAGDGTHKYLDTIGVIVQVAATLWLVEVYTRWGMQQGLPLTHGLASWIQWLLIIGLVTVLHEAAHALVGIGVGMKLRAFIVGPFQFQIRRGRWKFEFHPAQLLAFSGAAGLTPVDPDISRWHEVAMIAAGPFVNLLTGAVAAAFAYSAPDSPWWFLWESFALFATVSLVAGVVNLIPLRPDGLYSDGARVLQLFRQSPTADYHRVVKTVSCTLVSQRRPRDYDIQAIRRASVHFTAGREALLLRLFASSYYYDRHLIDEACKSLCDAERIFHESASDAPPELHTSFVIKGFFVGTDPAYVRYWWNSMQSKKLTNLDQDYLLAKCIFHWIEGDIPAARDTWNVGHAYLEKLPDAGTYNYDRDFYAHMKQILDATPESQAIETSESAGPIAEVVPVLASE